MFDLEYTPFIWPFVISLIITASLGAYAYRRRHIPAATTFAWMMAVLTVWTFCYVMELSSTSLAGKTFWASAKYFGSAPGPVLLFLLALQLTKNDPWVSLPFQMALWAFVILTVFVVFTNGFHHWYWTDIRVVAGFPETQVAHGFYFWIYAGASYLFVLISALLLMRYYWTTPAFYRRQALLMTLGGFVPLGGRILEDFFAIDLFPKVDNVILLFLISGLLFAYALFRYRALDIVHIGHNLVIQNFSAGIIVLDLLERVVELNPYARTLVSPTLTPMAGQPIEDVLVGWPALEIKTRVEQEVSVAHHGHERCFHIQSSQIKAENGEPVGYAVALFDITARKRAERQLETLARTDPLTGLLNRRRFYDLAEAEFARARRYQRPLAVMMFDIDHFKAINDTYGHAVGDEGLKAIAAHCQQHLRTTDIFARYGGEEFICLLDEAHPGDARRAAERLRQVIQAIQLEAGQDRIPITASVGLAHLPEAMEITLEGLIQQADQALYASKANGRNRVTVWGD